MKKVVVIGNSNSAHVSNRLYLFSLDKNLEVYLFDTDFLFSSEISVPRINASGHEFLHLFRIRKIYNILFSVLKLIFFRADVLFIMYCSKLALFYGLIFPNKLILSFWGSDILERGKTNLFYFNRFVIKLSVLRANSIYCVSQEIENEIFKICGSVGLKKPPKLLMYGIDLEAFSPDQLESMNSLKPFTIYSSRWCSPLYNIEMIIDAVIMLLNSGENVKLVYKNVYFGDDETAESYQQRLFLKMKESGFLENFEACGLLEYKEQVDLVKNSDVVVSVSHFDGTPVSILEAMACGTLTISGRIFATESIIKNGVNGYLVNKDDPEELFELIKEIIKNRGLTKDIIKNARKYVEDFADIKKEIEFYLTDFYED